MTTAYTSLLGLALPVTGELSGTWGDTVNNSITSLLDSAIAGTTTLSADTTLTTTTGASNQARQAILLCTGHSANITITAPAQSKIYTVINASATYTVKIRGVGPTTGITIPVSSTATVAWNGSDFVDASGYINGNLKVNGTLTVTGTATIGGNTAVTGTLSATGTLSGGTSGTGYSFSGSAPASSLTLESSGNLLVGATSNARSARIVSENAAGQQLALRYTGVATWYQNVNSSGILVWDKDNTEAMRLNTSLLTVTPGAVIQGLSIGLGSGSVSTNTILGNGALGASNTGDVNTAIGYQALNVNTSGQWNVGVGAYALKANQGGVNNTAMGRALVTNVSGTDNTAIGMNALYYNTASYNTAVGSNALLNNYGSYHVAVGYQALQANLSAVSNVAVGYQAMYSFNTSAGGNVAVGDGAMYDVKHTAGTNIAIGLGTMRGSGGTGAGNIAIGQATMYPLTTGYDNTIIGGYSSAVNPAGRQLNSGYRNVGIGSGALAATTSGSGNVAIGYTAGYLNQTGNDNTFVGNGAGYGGGQPNYGNVAVGVGSGGLLGAGGNYNTFIGVGSGGGVTTGGSNVIIGAYSGAAAPISATGGNNIVLSDGAGNVRAYWTNTGTCVIPQIYTDTTANAANVQVDSGGVLRRSTSALKYKQDIRDIEAIDINLLRGVRYKSKCEGDDQTKDHFGIVADEVDAAGIKELVSYGADGEVEGFQYERLTVVLLKAIQELKAEVDSLKSQLNGA